LNNALVTFLGLFGAPVVIQRLHSDSAPKDCAPYPTLVHPRRHLNLVN